MDDLERTLGLEVSVARLRTSGADADHNMAYREIDIHSKLMIIDDVFITVGSANLNQRSMSVDSEINIAATGQLYAADLRQRVFALHSGGDVAYSGDPKDLPDVFKLWTKTMNDNLSKMRKGQPMTGFLLPFEDHRSTTTLYGSISTVLNPIRPRLTGPRMKAFLNALRIATAALLMLVTSAHAGALTSLGNKLTTAMSDLPRYEKLPLFDPHRKDFNCVYEAQQVPPLDPQADVVSAGTGAG